jgi:F-type H+-transporting ATPase subunit epsilon
MQVEIITPDGKICEKEADSIVVPAVDGEMGILNDHASMLAELGKGIASVKGKDGETRVEINGGFLQIDNNNVGILAETAKLLD